MVFHHLNITACESSNAFIHSCLDFSLIQYVYQTLFRLFWQFFQNFTLIISKVYNTEVKLSELNTEEGTFISLTCLQITEKCFTAIFCILTQIQFNNDKL